ncbi:acyltransferase family protein [Actinosynnema sp.]|uniref:acyltransferase family protein n=1 Tax=Actinosynnema sp. TaxID=1872144 RepID=UPI003F84334A
MTPGPVLPPRLPSLTGIRAPLALLVFVAHALGSARFFADESVNSLGFLLPYGPAALSLFFVLSGFVLVWSEPWREGVGPYFRRRVVRILPTHVLTWAAVLLLLAALGPLPLLGPLPEVGPALVNLSLLQSLVPLPDYLLSVNGINWSVSCEVVFDLLLPLLSRPLLRVPDHRLWACFGVLAAVVLALPGMIGVLVDGPPWALWPPLSFEQAWLVNFFPLTRLPEFLMGVVLARIVATGRWRPVRSWWPLLGVAAVWALLPVLPQVYARSAIAAVPLALLVPVIAVRDLEGRRSVLSRRWVRVAGDMSYATYLLHWPLLAVAKHVLGDRLLGLGEGLLLVAALYALTQGLSLLLHRWVERPLLRRAHRPRRSPAPDPAG